MLSWFAPFHANAIAMIAWGQKQRTQLARSNHHHCRLGFCQTMSTAPLNRSPKAIHVKPNETAQACR